MVDPVHAVVACGDGAGPVDVAGDQGAQDVTHLRLARLGELGEVDVGGEGRQVGELAATLGDAGAVIAHPLQLAGHVEEAEGLTELGGLCRVGQRLEGERAHLDEEGVDAGVVADDRGTEVDIALDQASGGAGHGSIDLVPHGQDEVAQALQLRVEAGHC